MHNISMSSALLFIVVISAAMPCAALEWFEFNKNKANHPNNNTLEVKAPYINIHTGPGRGYPIHHIVESGEQIQLLRRFNHWYKIKDSRDTQGWVNEENLTSTVTASGQPFITKYQSEADYFKRRWEGGVQTGEFGSTSAISGYITYHFTEHLSVETTLMQVPGSISTTTLLLLGLFHQPFPTWRVAPYFGLGTGLSHTETNGDVSQTDDLLHTGLGIRTYFAKEFLLRAGYNHTIVFTGQDENTGDDDNREINGWTLGLSAFF